MKKHTGYKLTYWREFDINNKKVLMFSIETYKGIIKEYGKIEKYLNNFISEPFDWKCIPIIK